MWLRYGAVKRYLLTHTRSPPPPGFRDVRLRGRRAPVAFSAGDTRSTDPSGDYVCADPMANRQWTNWPDLYRVARWRMPRKSPNGRPNGICWQAGRGMVAGTCRRPAYVRLIDIDANPRHTVESVSLTFQEYDFDPFGVVE